MPANSTGRIFALVVGLKIELGYFSLKELMGNHRRDRGEPETIFGP
jgi:hypothetical protein